ncbi:MAG: leucine-rich repeat protein [Erysipelotrichaceae bacterium]|nr:leucine-rich repeat protein [Erysipelotrichaceae bacterium]
MALHDPIGVWFSELEDNWEERDFHHESVRSKESYRYYGDLPDGLCYGAVFFRASDPWPPAVCITICDIDGNSLLNSAVSEDFRTWLYEWPEAVVSSPGGRSIVCMINGRIYGWTQDKEGFVSDNGSFLDERLEGLKVLDARMHNNGILQLKLEDGRTMGYLCDADVILYPWVNGWIADKDESWKIADSCKEGVLDPCPESVTVVIREEDRWGEYEGCGVHKAYIEPGTKRIEGCVLSENPDLMTITIPDSVEYIEWGAFLNCRNLQKLFIEGDLSRVANWNKGAFEGCPCEEYYLSLYNMNS